MQKKAYHPQLDTVQSLEAKMRHAVLNIVYELFNQEVSALCGPLFSHKGKKACHRAGSDPASVLSSWTKG